MNEAAVSQVLFASGRGASVTRAMLEPVDAEGLVWHPLLYFGEFKHPKAGEFKVDAALCEAFIANFSAGLPTSNGIPIDQDNLHRQREEGAFGWIKALEVRAGQLWGGIQWTDAGKREIETERLPFISPTWYAGSEANPSYPGVTELLFGGALVTTPFFWQQPTAKTASAFAVIEIPAAETSAGGQDTETAVQATGGIPMDEARVRELVQTKYGEMTDEAWAEATKDVGDEDGAWDTFLLEHVAAKAIEASAADDDAAEGEDADSDEPEAETAAAKLLAEKAELERLLAEKDSEIEAAKVAASAALDGKAALAEQVGALTKDVDTLKAEKHRLEVRATVEATAFGTAFPTPAAVDVLTAVQVDPSPETVKALLDHIAARGGKLDLLEPGEKGALIEASATNDGESWLEAQGYTQSTKEAIRALVEGDKRDLAAMQAADKRYWQSQG